MTDFKPGDRVILATRVERDYRDRTGVILSDDDPRIKSEWSGWRPGRTSAGHIWVWLDEKTRGYHSWQFRQDSYRLLEISAEDLAAVYKSLGVKDA